jgi:hypothetical protein
VRGIQGAEYGVVKVQSALGVEYSKAWHYTIAHLRRSKIEQMGRAFQTILRRFNFELKRAL